MSTPTFLRYVHIPKVIPFHTAQTLQGVLVQQHLAHKALSSKYSRSPSERLLPPAPPPTVITFTPHPVYTLGRREHDSLSPAQQSLLRAPLNPETSWNHNRGLHPEFASIESTLRGGQTTFHGPGQLVVYPVFDIKSRFPRYERGLGVREYVHLLEQTTIETLGLWDIDGVRTENPGVWQVDGEKKIAALGVHLRRNISSYGVGLNVKTDLRWFDRIVACGLVGKGVTSMMSIKPGKHWGRKNARGLEEDGFPIRSHGQPRKGAIKVGRVGRSWVQRFASGLWGEERGETVVKVRLEDLWAEVEEARGLEEVFN